MVRKSGILLHITSLPGPYGIGDLGPRAQDLVNRIADAGQSLWQVLPTVPVGPGNSPYMSPSTFAGTPLLVSPDRLVERGLLEENDVKPIRGMDAGRVDYAHAHAFKRSLLEKAYRVFRSDAGHVETAEFEAWCTRESSWLDDYALFENLNRSTDGGSWNQWPADIRRRDRLSIERLTAEREADLRRVRFEQYVFASQWDELKRHAAVRGVGLVGDLPIYVALDSADVWSSQELFRLDADGRPVVVAGVPPDYFSETGQLWGNPIYNWEASASSGHAWWVARFRRMLDQFDMIRLDHFRGFEAYWAIPAHEETAVNGVWEPGPGDEFFRTLQRRLGRLPIIAENLGVITPGVTALMDRLGFPGMAVLQFALDGEMGTEYLPENLRENLVAYTGTHDNDTFLGWWRNEGGEREPEAMARTRAVARKVLGTSGDGEEEVLSKGIEALMRSKAGTVIVPLQDILALDASARMNTPGTGEGNWEWRMVEGQLTDAHLNRLRALTEAGQRSRFGPSAGFIRPGDRFDDRLPAE